MLDPLGPAFVCCACGSPATIGASCLDHAPTHMLRAEIAILRTRLAIAETKIAAARSTLDRM